MLMAAGALAILTIALAAGSRLTGGGHMPVPVAPVDVARDFRFEDAPDGAVIVHARAVDGPAEAPERRVAVLAPGEMMFVRSTLRALARGRRIDGGGGSAEQVPFRVTRFRDGRVTLDDLATQQHVELSAFGPTNSAAFESLLEKARD
jgi:putative photosynthetic complex assembly protein